MKKYLSIFMILTLMWSMPLGVKAEDSESSRPPDISNINKNIQNDIDQALDDADQIPAPTDIYDNAAPSVDTDSLLNPDQILDAVVAPANQNKAMDLQFEEVNLESILRTIGDVAEINIILDPELKSKTLSLHLKAVKIHEALSIIAESYGLGFKKIGSSLFVTTREKIRTDKVTGKLINLRYIKADDVKAMSHNLVDTINVARDNNAVMVVGTPEEIDRIQDLVKKMDKPQPQVILEAQIIEVNKDAMKNLGMQWSQSITTNFQENLRPVSFNNVQNAVGSVMNIYSFSRNPLQFSATLNMLENDNLAKVLANPRIITINNQEAQIFVGDRIPYTVSTVYNGVVTNNVQFVEPGIRLKITPSIIDKDFVVIKIEPEVSYIYSFIGPQNQYPWVKTRNATAYVRIQNNHPFILGGLLDKEDQKSLFKVPIIGNLPLIGNLFSYQTHTVTDSELIITVVPTIVNQ